MTAPTTANTGSENITQNDIIMVFLVLGLIPFFFAIIAVFTYKLTKLATKFGKLPRLYLTLQLLFEKEELRA
jgi:hypothetical protein